MAVKLSRSLATLGGLLALTAGLLAQPSAGMASAWHMFLPPGFMQAQSPPALTRAASQIGVLRGRNLSALAQRFSADARRQADTVPGQTTGSGTINVNNWTLNPSGTQMDLGSLPVNAVLAPNGKTMLVVNSGAGVQSLEVVDLAAGAAIQTIPYPSPSSVFVGAAYSPDGTHAYVSGGGQNVVHTFSVDSNGMLTATGDIADESAVKPFTSLSTSSYPTGLSVSADGKSLYVANSNANDVVVMDMATRKITATIPVGSTPYGTLVTANPSVVLVSNWGDGTLSVIDPRTNTVVATTAVGAHPTAMTQGPRGMIYLSDSNSDAVSIVDPQTFTEVRRVSVMAGLPLPLSASPQGLSVSPDGNHLYVADAGQNAISIFNLSFDGRSAYFQGWMPTAWYPTDVVASPDGGSLFVTNGFGMGEHANNGPLDPNPTRPTPAGVPLIQSPGYCTCSLDQFSGTMDVGTLSTVSIPTTGQLFAGTIQVMQNDRLLDLSRLDRSSGNPVPQPGGTSPIKHVIYIVKENRTYDQILGDDTAGKGDASLTLFPRSVTPNLHALADRFGVLDNFYADAQVSADGHNWTLSANANDYTEKLWPQDYSTPNRNFGYPFENGTSLPLSPGGYLWDAAAAAGISYRDYGLYANFVNSAAARVQPESQPCAGPITHTYIGTTIPAGSVLCFPPTTVNASVVPNLVGHIDPRFQNYDMSYPDVERVLEWKREFNDFVTNNNLPALEIMRLSSDHTRGTAANTWTPQHFVADNDAAVGQVVDAVSHSSYWSSTAIFVVEDDAQNGPDHLDSHRTTAYIISPYTSQATPRADSTHYDTASMVRTIELLLGLQPLSQFDATATPMWRLFGSTPDTTPYTALPQGAATATTTAHMFGEKQSNALNFALPDQASAIVLNHILWHDIKGARVPYPGPDPYGIPSLASEQAYMWGILSARTYPLLNTRGVQPLHILNSTRHSAH